MTCWPNGSEVTTGRVVERGRELGAVRLKVGLAAAPVLRPPDAERALVDRPGVRRVWVGDNRRVEVRALRAGGDGPRRDDPLRRVAVLEVHVSRLPSECVEPQRGVGCAEA